MANTPEGVVKNAVKKVLLRHNVYSYMPVSNGMGAPSLDFLVCANGRWIGVETKAPGKKPTERQEVTMAKMRAAGGVCFVIDGDVSALDKYLEEICRT